MLNCLLVLLIAFVGFFWHSLCHNPKHACHRSNGCFTYSHAAHTNTTNTLDGLPYVSASSLNARAQQSAMIYASATQPMVQARSSR